MSITIVATESAATAADQAQQLLEVELLVPIARIEFGDRASVDMMFEAIADDDDARVVHVVSPDMLVSPTLMAPLLERLSDDQCEASYSGKVLPILLMTEFSPDRLSWQRTGLTDFWRALHDDLGLKLTTLEAGDDVDSVIDRQETAEFISASIGEYHELIDRNRDLFRSLDEFLSLRPAELRALFSPIRAEPIGPAEPSESRRAHLQMLHDAIFVPPPGVPEFPPSNPRSPATPHYDLEVRSHKILLKDEGQNPTGSHKDRLAWETIVFYKRLLRTRLLTNAFDAELPSLSMISSGSAAVAVQTMLNAYHLPPLRVIVDASIDTDIATHLGRIGCIVFPVGLAERLLTREDVLRITENPDGFDITSRATVDSNETKYYDWLTYEILNLHPRWIFVPVGTGDLYGNIARIIFDSLVSTEDHSYNRLHAAKSDLQGICLMGATTTNPQSFLDKLYAPFTPELERVKAYVEDRRDYLDARSDIVEVDDGLVREALNIAISKSIVTTEPSGIAGLALFLSWADQIPRGDRIVVVNTGRLYIPGKSYDWRGPADAGTPGSPTTKAHSSGSSRARTVGSRIARK